MESSTDTTKVISQLKSLGVAQYLLGGLGLVSPLLAYTQRFGTRTTDILRRLDALMWTGDTGFYMKTTLATSVLVSLFLIGAGAATSKLHPSARSLTFAHVALGVANGAYNLFVAFGILVPALLEFGRVEGPVGMGGAIGGIIGGAIGGLFSLLFPAFEVWMITRPGVRAVLSRQPSS